MSRLEMIRDYYRRIDRQDLDWVVELFASDAVYERADARYAGRDAIEHFFREERLIRGVHTIATLTQDETGRIFARGRFEGHGAAKDARSVRFADVWEFRSDDKVCFRQTYLALGHAYVER